MNTIYFIKKEGDAYEGLLYSKYLKIFFIIVSFCIYVLVLTYISIIHNMQRFCWKYVTSITNSKMVIKE